ncbi:neprilysin-1-like [Haematobia irritans]|uniref:neprilysin-1-like n=1 Tax=Haematobia irritans TaxID=7368 RepID=UPI003F507A25
MLNRNLKIFFFIKIILVLLTLCPKANGKLNPENPYHREIMRLAKAADIKSWMNTKINPCENFFQFSCNRWSRINPAETFQVYNTNQFEEMSSGLQLRINRMLNESDNRGNEFEEKVNGFYQSCLRLQDNREQYKNELKRIYGQYGEFSFVQRQKQQKEYLPPSKINWWWSLIADIHLNYGKSIILALDIENDVKDNNNNTNNNNNQTMLYIGPPSLLSGEPYVEKKMAKYMRNIFGLSRDQASKETNRLLSFDEALSFGGSDTGTAKTLQELLTRYSTQELIDKYAESFDLRSFLELALNTTKLPAEIYLYDESYLENLLKIVQTTDITLLQDYILWILLDEYLEDFSDITWSKFCGEKVRKYFGKFIIHNIYKTFRSEWYEEEIYEIWQNIKDAFRDNLKGFHYNWMSLEVRQAALGKLENIQLITNTYDNEDFPAFFRNLQIDKKNYVANIERILRNIESLRPNKLMKKSPSIDATQELSFTPVYENFENAIKIPIALLQTSRILSPIYPKAIEYGSMGFLLAHEMLHGFDDMGRGYDANGHLRNWWDANSTKEFEKRQNCFQFQYNLYMYGVADYVEYSQSENIADNGAIQLAFKAYTKWLEQHSKSNEKFPKLNYTGNELFFIGFSQLWCSNVHPKYRDFQGTHAPAMFRVIGSLANFPQFSKIFHCPSGSQMNPSVKCSIY